MKTDETNVLSPDERPAPKPRKQRGLWWVMKWSLAIIVPMIVVIVLLNFRLGPGKGKPLVRVSPQTTFATSPLKPSGDVDYVAFLNQQHAVTPENNAFVDLLYIKGPMVAKKMPPPEFFQLLGIKPPPAMGDYLVEFPFENKAAGVPAVLSDGTTLDCEQVYEVTQLVPFGRGEFPVVDAWFDKNEKHLNAIHRAVDKPGFYIPFVGDDVSGVLMTHAYQMRTFARSLCRSAIIRLGRGDVAGSIDDEIAILRLARHVGRNGTLIDYLDGHAIQGIAYSAISQTVFSGKCSADELAKLAAELDRMAVLPVPGVSQLEAERVMALDAVIRGGRDGPMPGSYLNRAPGRSAQKAGFGDKLIRSTIDWESVCIGINELFDGFGKVLDAEGTLKQGVAADAFQTEMQSMESAIDSPGKMLGSSLGGRTSRGKMIASMQAMSMLPAFHQLTASNRQMAALNAVARVAVALERHRIQHGTYPKQLDELVPEFLEAVPADPFGGDPLVYKPDQGDPFLLYSVGPNKSDDGGVGMFEAPNNQFDLIAAPIVRTVDDWIKKNKQTP